MSRVERTVLPNGKVVERQSHIFWHVPSGGPPMLIGTADYDHHFIYKTEERKDTKGPVPGVMCTCGAPAIVRMDRHPFIWRCYAVEAEGGHRNVGQGWE